MTLLEAIGAHAAVRLCEAALDSKENRLDSLKCRVLLRNRRLRVAMSNLLCIQRDGRYLLVRNSHRPYEFGPFGGVVKYFESARAFLDDIGFEPHVITSHRDDMVRDLRGFFKAKHLPRFISWFAAQRDREHCCVMRELVEELREAVSKDTVGSGPSIPSTLVPRLVRQIHEPLRQPRGTNYLQYRLFQVFELDGHKPDLDALTTELFGIASSCDNLLVATPSDLRRCRAEPKHLIGGHSIYLVDDTPRKEEPEPLPDS